MSFRAEGLLARIEPLFLENFARFGELGAEISIWHLGQAVLQLRGGYRDARRETPWTNDTLVLLWSVTKGLGSACLLHLLQERKIELDRRVTQFWPEFGQNGKSEITIAQLLSHQAGLSGLDQAAEVRDFEAVVKALENQKPLWPPGAAHGYHARTFGFLIDALMRRIDSRSIGQYWRDTFADPLGLEIWIGLPAELSNRVATIYAPKLVTSRSPNDFYRAVATPGTLQHKTFTTPRGLPAVSAMNLPENQARSFVSFGAIGNAFSLGKFYAMLANDGQLDGQYFFSKRTLTQMTTTLVDGLDRVFGFPTAFSAGYMKDPPGGTRRIFGPSQLAFGHPGAGGSHAFADPENRLSFAYVMNQMEQQVLPNEKSLRLVDALYR